MKIATVIIGFFLIILFSIAVLYIKKNENRTLEKTNENINNENTKTTILLWEDNYLSAELIPKENLEFAIKETKRIKKHAEEHFDGNGFTEITKINKIPFSTEKKEILTSKITDLLESIGLVKYGRVLYYGGGTPTEIENQNTIVYGELKSGIFIEQENNKIEHIWIDSQNWQEISKTKIKDGLIEIGEMFDLILVDWNSTQVIDLKKESEIEKYLWNE
ncbi:hypothetical protein [Tenacibaculum sp. IB213877]|uniref:hypothetical protein n=1 Tax=Tenacibaculum sp. IB213877 TaxID=3097351 RepID=UPI002A59E9F3|nr:hypothetical protein [Tenacibaculum sp. IB213877]MDY0781691.1 hypothetical protein [Tenacibaculum sp. IB213877]